MTIGWPYGPENYWYWQQPAPCPTCGHCPTCGQRTAPIAPQFTWKSDTVTTDGTTWFTITGEEPK